MITYTSINKITLSHYLLNIKSWNYVCALLTAIFILSSGVSTAFAAPDSPPTLKLVKSVITDDGGSAVADEWNLFAFDGTEEIIFNQGGSGNFETVPANTELTLFESEGPGGYLPGVWSCDGGQFSNPDRIELSLGDRVTCTITNNDVAPTLKLVKELILDNGGEASENEWMLSATSSGASAKRNFDDQGGSEVFHTVFANTVYDLTESGGPSGFTAVNDGKWTCVVMYPNGFEANFSGIFGISLNEGDKAVCTITNDDDAPSLSLDVPSKITGKITMSAKVKGFIDSVPVNFKIYKMDGKKSMIYDENIPMPFSVTFSARYFDAGFSYLVEVHVTDNNGKSAFTSSSLDIPAKGNSK